MKTKKIVDQVKQILKDRGIEVRTEKGNFRGGQCLLGDQNLIVLNRHHLPEVQLAVLAKAIHAHAIETESFPGPLVKAIEEAWAPEQEMSIEDPD